MGREEIKKDKGEKLGHHTIGAIRRAGAEGDASVGAWRHTKSP